MLIDGREHSAEGQGNNGWLPGCWVLGTEAGSGESLARIMIEYFKNRKRGREREGESDEILNNHQDEIITPSASTSTTSTSNSNLKTNKQNPNPPSPSPSPSPSHSKTKKILFLTGKLHKAILPTKLRESGFEVEEIVLYETRVDDGFESEFGKMLRRTERTEKKVMKMKKREDEKVGGRMMMMRRTREGEEAEEEEDDDDDEKHEEMTRRDESETRETGEGMMMMERKDEEIRWVVMFSGQGAREVLRGLGWDDDRGNGRVSQDEEGEHRENARGIVTGGRREGSRRSGTTFVASIGRTTADYLKTKLGFQVDVCAEQPTPDALREAIERFMEDAPEGNFAQMTPPAGKAQESTSTHNENRETGLEKRKPG